MNLVPMSLSLKMRLSMPPNANPWVSNSPTPAQNVRHLNRCPCASACGRYTARRQCPSNPAERLDPASLNVSDYRQDVGRIAICTIFSGRSRLLAGICEFGVSQAFAARFNDHGRAATTSRGRSIASIRIAISGRPGSSRVKFGTGLVTTALRPCNNRECTCSPTVTLSASANCLRICRVQCFAVFFR